MKDWDTVPGGWRNSMAGRAVWQAQPRPDPLGHGELTGEASPTACAVLRGEVLEDVA